jgi:hypothetical protein
MFDNNIMAIRDAGKVKQSFFSYYLFAFSLNKRHVAQQAKTTTKLRKH